MSATRPLAITPGEPAGIGPDLLLQLTASHSPRPLVAIADPCLLEARANQLGLTVNLREWPGPEATVAFRPGQLWVQPVSCPHPVTPGQPDPANAGYLLNTLDRAVDGCLRGDFCGLVTGPLHKGVINDAGIPFSGHTEYLAARSNVASVVMMLACHTLRVALVTTHLPLSAVASQITVERLTTTLRILDSALRRHFALMAPRILVCGLNPHAGEAGHLGHEELTIITPVLEQLRHEGLHLTGPVPADTAFVPASLEAHDAVLAMYHDQGLPVLKHRCFGQAANITLGLPFLRTSVDHGTALPLAATGRASITSLAYAVDQALVLLP